MSHRFEFSSPIPSISAEQFQRILSLEAFHIGLAKELHGDNLEVLELAVNKESAIFRRKHPLEANLPAVLQKMVNGKLMTERTDNWNLRTMTCSTTFRLSLPVDLALQIRVAPTGKGLVLHNDWAIKVNIPLIGKTIAATIEQDVRKQAQSELQVLERFCAGLV